MQGHFNVLSAAQGPLRTVVTGSTVRFIMDKMIDLFLVAAEGRACSGL